MKNTLLFTILVSGLVLSGCNRSTRTDTAATEPVTTPVTTEPTVGQQMENTAQRTGDAIADAGRSAAGAMREAGQELSAEMREWRLSAQDLEADLRADRDIVRTKSAGTAPVGNVDKSMLKRNVEANVNSKVPNLRDIDVEIDHETEVVLTGKARSADQIGQAMGAALSTQGVTKVTSKIDLEN